ncbi:VOC family protein [Ideonella sp. YS5]|uniref:VOC family protein n=1 Tax=Ideonella sp. YS5 TaxID=3453714 RepID=UPI003EEBB357
MAVLGFSHYNLRAPRPMLDRLRDFYVEVVGLQAGPRPPFRSFGYWLYAGGEPVLHLSEAAPGESRACTGSTTFDHAAFRCSDLGETESRLAALGIAFERAEVPTTGIVQLFFSDPAGNGVELGFVPASSPQ